MAHRTVKPGGERVKTSRPPPERITPKKRRRVQVGGRRVRVKQALGPLTPQRRLSDANITKLAGRSRRRRLPSVRSLSRPATAAQRAEGARSRRIFSRVI